MEYGYMLCFFQRQHYDKIECADEKNWDLHEGYRYYHFLIKYDMYNRTIKREADFICFLFYYLE